jgi:hypothetical protein
MPRHAGVLTRFFAGVDGSLLLFGRLWRPVASPVRPGRMPAIAGRAMNAEGEGGPPSALLKSESAVGFVKAVAQEVSL